MLLATALPVEFRPWEGPPDQNNQMQGIHQKLVMEAHLGPKTGS